MILSATRRGASFTVGLCTNASSSEHAHQRALWTAVSDAAYERRVNLVVFSGADLGNAPAQAAQNQVYRLASGASIDGLILLPVALGGRRNEARFVEFCAAFGSLPRVSVGEKVAELPSVIVDHEAGVRAAVEHLVHHHRRRKIAFLRGVESDAEAEARYRAYIDALAENGLPFDPRRVLEGDCRRERSRDAVQRLLRDRPGSIDAVIAANDGMAWGALDALVAAGLTVPGQAIVIGGDSSEQVIGGNPTLTSLRLPFREMAFRALDLLLEILAGRRVPRTVHLASQLCLRETCGCSATCIAPGLGKEAGEEPLERRRSERDLGAESSAPVAGEGEMGDFEWRIQLLIAAVQRMLTLALSPRDPSVITPELSEVATRLGALGVDSCYVALCDPGATVLRERATLVLAFEEGRVVPLEAGGVEFAVRQLLPEGLGEGETLKRWVVRLLQNRGEVLGFVILGSQPTLSVDHFSLVVEYLAGAFRELSLPSSTASSRPLTPADEVLPRNVSLARRGPLRGGLSEEAWEQLMVLERYASVGRVTASFAHDLSSPLGAVRAALAKAERVLIDCEATRDELSAGGPSSVGTDGNEPDPMYRSMREALRLAGRGAEQAVVLLRAMRQDLRDAEGPASRPFSVGRALEEVVATLSPALARSGCQVELDLGPPKSELVGRVARLRMAVSHLIWNAMDALSPLGGGTIRAALTESSLALEIEVRIPGVVLESEELPLLFDPRWNSKALGPRSTLGLAIARDMVEGEFHGSMGVDCSSEQGTVFRIRLPKAPGE